MAVLVVDDAEPVRKRLMAMIREAAAPLYVPVEGAESISSAVSTLETSEIGAIVLDFHLLGEHGLDAIARVRARKPDALLVILTNGASDSLRRECEELGADFFFDKSHEFERAVAVVVDRILATRGS
jgi:DNA-binding NarL/FixJ family response regulator